MSSIQVKDTIHIGVSACLLGEKVRYDGGHKMDPFLVHTLGRYVEYIPVCPEVEAGFGVPREALRLKGDPEAPRLVTRKNGVDVTERLLEWAGPRLLELKKAELCGFIFKSQSPSSGMKRVKVYSEKGVGEKKGVGIFARAFMKYFPYLPVEEEGQLHDFHLRENFIERIFTYWRWKQMLAEGMNPANLVEFHTRHKLLLMAHHPKKLKEIGKWVAQAGKIVVEELFNGYFPMLMEAMKARATVPKHVNVLMHMMGYFKKQLTADEKKELLEVISDYRNQDVPLLVPLTLIKRYVRKYRQNYLQNQCYLIPHPLELRL